VHDIDARSRLRARFDDLGRWIRGAEQRPLALSLLALEVAAGVSIAMAIYAGVGRTHAAVNRVEPLWILIALAGTAVSYAGFATAFQGTVIRGALAQMPTGLALKLVAFGAAASSLLGGYSVDRRALQAAGASRGDAGVRVIAMSGLEYAVLAFAAWISAIVLLPDGHAEKAVTVPWVIGFPAGCALALAATVYVPSPGSAAEGLLRRAAGMTLEALTMLREQVRHPVRNRAAWVGIVLHWAGDLAIMWAALRAVGLQPSLAVVVLGYATGYVFSPRSLPLAGVGVTEALMPLAMSWLGVPLASAVVAVFLYRGGRLLVAIPPALLARPDVQRLMSRMSR
jgi:uncharacterized membrane protein YbhN (UPF0104 family)